MTNFPKAKQNGKEKDFRKNGFRKQKPLKEIFPFTKIIILLNSGCVKVHTIPILKHVKKVGFEKLGYF